MSQGKVWLVGAGPGDAGLMTLKGKQVLEEADVIVYDSLVGKAILSTLPKHAEHINVGKRAAHHIMSQWRINEVLLEKAQEGKKVVRLKGGDPFLFGRGGEELEKLAAAGIPFEVVPGVTSSIAVPAYNGIPVTHRDYTSSLHIITGHKKEGQPLDIDFEALVRTKGTLVFLMGISALGDIVQGLLKAGIDPKMPAAVLQQGTTAGQKRVVSDVETICEAVRVQGIQTPAIIIVGKVCALSEEFSWYEKAPLAGWRVLVTRPRGQMSQTAMQLREKGAEVLEIPSIETVPCRENEALKAAVEKLDTYDWLVFTSPTGVEIFFGELLELGADIRALGKARIAAIGEGTRKKLAQRFLQADFMPSVYDGDHLGEELAALLTGKEKILIPRAEKGNENLTAFLRKTGAQVDDLATYRTVYVQSDVLDEKKAFENGEIDCVVFTSASTVKGFAESTPGLDHTGIKAACIGKQTRAAADVLGMETWMSEKATIESLIDCVIKMKKESGQGRQKEEKHE